MTEQGKSPKQFCIQKAFQKGPLHLLHGYRLSQLQNKINFFQGQVDPLLQENLSLKEQLIALSKLVVSSTEILRNLLPTYDDPTKRLKLQMATIEEIATMIKEDWLRMENRLAENTKAIKKLRDERDHWKDCFEEEKIERAREVYGLQEASNKNKIELQACIQSLKLSLSGLSQVHEQQKKQMLEDFAYKIRSYQESQRQFQRYRRQARDKEEEYEKKINRLNGEIDAHLLSFQETKKNIKAIYDKLMGDKLSEQAQGFQMLLKMKEDEKMQVIIAMNEAEDEYKRKAAQKQYQITKLTERNDSYRQEVGNLKNDIWKKQLQLDKQFQQARAREEIIAKLQNEKKNLKKQIEENIDEFTQQKKALEKIITSKNEEISLLREQGSVSLQKALNQKSVLQKQLADKEQKLRQTLITLRKKDEVWEKQVNKLRQQWKAQEQAIKNQLLSQQNINKTWSDKLTASQKQKAEIIKQHNQKLKRIEDIHKQHQYILESKFQAKISELKEAQQIEMNQIKTLHQRELTEANINASESLREVMANCNRRMTEQQVNFLAQKSQFEQQIKQKQEEVKKTQKKLKQATLLIEKHEIEHKESIRQMAQAASKEKQRMEQEFNKQMIAFQEEIEKHEARLNEMKAEMEKQIKLLKEANAIETIQNRFLNQISKLKQQFAQKIKKTELQFKKSEQALLEQHQNKIEEIKQGFNQNLIKIVQNVEQKSTYLNEKLFTGFNDSQFKKMSEDQKKQYIINKVQQIKKNNTQKERKIDELQFALDQAEKNIEKRVKARKEELERQKDKLAKECSERIENMTKECNNKVEQTQRNRIQHSQAMYVEFQTLRDHHQGLLNALNKKYLELELLFQQRPSRMEDVTKIKQLINMQTKLDIEIQSYQKKMETANQIVKYLNLQLENYKDSYDIFGPNGEHITGGIVGVSALRNSNNGSNNPNPDTLHILDVIKSHRHGSQARLMSEQRKEILKEPLAFRKWNDIASPVIKDLKLFQDDQSQHSAVQSRDFSQSKEDKKYSYLIVDKSTERKNRFKTEKNEKIEHQSQILINAENFIKLIKGNQEDTPHPVIRESDQERRKSYRKRKLHKRQPTQGFDHYF